MKKRFIIFFLISFILADSYSFSLGAPGLRIVSLAPSTTEILFALGAGEEVVGVSSFCNYPQEASRKEKVGTFSQPNIEKILSLKPDIIFCTGLEQEPVVRGLKELNLKVCVSDPSNMEGLFSSILDMGKLISKEKEAEELINKMKRGIAEITSKSKLIPEQSRPKVFIEIWNEPLMTTGKGSFIDELVTLAGGKNIAYDTHRPFCYFSAEQVIKRNPDCIILTYMTSEIPTQAVGKRLGWQKISAVKNKRIYNDINPDLLLRPGPRLVEGLKELHKRFYP